MSMNGSLSYSSIIYCTCVLFGDAALAINATYFIFFFQGFVRRVYMIYKVRLLMAFDMCDIISPPVVKHITCL